MPHRWLGAAIALAIGAAPAIAVPGGSVEYIGRTSQGPEVQFYTDDGVAAWLHIYEFKAPCEKGRPYAEGEAIYPRFDEATTEDATLTDRYRRLGPHTGPVRASITMQRVNARRWTGTFVARIRIRAHGEFTDRCETSFTFAVHRVSPRSAK